MIRLAVVTSLLAALLSGAALAVALTRKAPTLPLVCSQDFTNTPAGRTIPVWYPCCAPAVSARVCYLICFRDPQTGQPKRYEHGHYLGTTTADRLDEHVEEHRTRHVAVLTAGRPARPGWTSRSRAHGRAATAKSAS